jgi:hypothetical protein
MNPFNLHIPLIRAELPVGGVIRATCVDSYIGTAAVVARTRNRAATILREARLRKRQATFEAAAIMANAREVGHADAQEAAQAAVTAAVADAVSWLLDAEALEARMVKNLESRCRHWVAETINHFAGEADRATLIAKRIEAHIHEFTSRGRFAIFVSDADIEPVRQQLSEIQRSRLFSSPTLSSGEGYIDSPFLQIKFDIEKHLTALLAQVSYMDDSAKNANGMNVLPNASLVPMASATILSNRLDSMNVPQASNAERSQKLFELPTGMPHGDSLPTIGTARKVELDSIETEVINASRAQSAVLGERSSAHQLLPTSETES